MKVNFAKPGAAAPGAIAVGIYHGLQQTAAARQLDRKTGGALSRALSASRFRGESGDILTVAAPRGIKARSIVDRKSTRLNSSHLGISYAVFCLKKKNKKTNGQLASEAKQTKRGEDKIISD